MLSSRNSGAKVMLLADITVILPRINKTFNYFYSIYRPELPIYSTILLFNELQTALKTVHTANKRRGCFERGILRHRA